MSITGRIVGGRLKDVAVVMGLDDLAPVGRRAPSRRERRRFEIGEPVEELKRRQLDDAVGSRSRGLSPAAQADPVGRPEL
jgi:hypothetical protein